MKTILDRLDLVTTWLLVMLGAGVFIAGLGFGAVVAGKTTPSPFKPIEKWNGFISPLVTNNQSTVQDGRNYDWKEAIGPVIGISDESLRVHHCIWIGEGATGTNNYELVITFTDGTEIRQMLPTNKTVNLPWMK